MSKIDQIAEDVSELKVMVAENTITLKHNAQDIREHIKRTNLLEKQMKVALIPIHFAKWSVAAAAGTATILGLLRLLQEFLQ